MRLGRIHGEVEPVGVVLNEVLHGYQHTKVKDWLNISSDNPYQFALGDLNSHGSGDAAQTVRVDEGDSWC